MSNNEDNELHEHNEQELCEDCVEKAMIIEQFVDRDIVFKLFQSLPNYASTWDKDTASAICYIAERIGHGFSTSSDEEIIDMCDKLSAYLTFRALQVLEYEREEDAEREGPPVQGNS